MQWVELDSDCVSTSTWWLIDDEGHWVGAVVQEGDKWGAETTSDTHEGLALDTIEEAQAFVVAVVRMGE